MAEPMTRAEMNEGIVLATTKLERGSLEWRAVHALREMARELQAELIDVNAELDRMAFALECGLSDG
jgi:hypothetical protein